MPIEGETERAEPNRPIGRIVLHALRGGALHDRQGERGKRAARLKRRAIGADDG
jgi:hypothetical protein